MESLALFFSASGRIAPKPFVLGALAVYALSFVSQFLLAAPITSRVSFIPFVAVQAIAGWAWYALHVKRLRDSGRGPGGAVALTIIYALAIVLLLLLMISAHGMTPPPDGNRMPAAVGMFAIFVVVFLTSLVLGNAAFGVFGYVFLGALVLITLPALISTAFSIWLANRPSVAPAP
jgi:uncharacterized membrane protein YhaH (DUF805 family)